MRSIQRATWITVVAVFAINGCGGDGNGAGGGGTCNQNYTTQQLTGCFQSDTANGATLDYYCFDGAGGYKNDSWMQMTGCANLHNGQYELKGCTLKVCDENGCSQYNFKADQSGVLLDGKHYTSGSGCH